MSLHPELTTADLKKMRRHTLDKGAALAAMLEDLLAGQDVRLETLPLLGQPDPEWTQIIRLRHYLRELAATRERIDQGTVGICGVCDQPIAVIALLEMPWAETCAACAGTPIVASA